MCLFALVSDGPSPSMDLKKDRCILDLLGRDENVQLVAFPAARDVGNVTMDPDTGFLEAKRIDRRPSAGRLGFV